MTAEHHTILSCFQQRKCSHHHVCKCLILSNQYSITQSLLTLQLESMSCILCNLLKMIFFHVKDTRSLRVRISLRCLLMNRLNVENSSLNMKSIRKTRQKGMDRLITLMPKLWNCSNLLMS